MFTDLLHKVCDYLDGSYPDIIEDDLLYEIVIAFTNKDLEPEEYEMLVKLLKD